MDYYEYQLHKQNSYKERQRDWPFDASATIEFIQTVPIPADVVRHLTDERFCLQTTCCGDLLRSQEVAFFIANRQL